MIEKRICPVCGDAITGRKDKKFCSDQCRNIYNNEKFNVRLNYNYIRNVNRILKKNRDILAKLNPDGKRKIHRDKLTALGFNFEYITRTYTTQKGNTYLFCYDFGYLPLENDFYLLIEWKERN